jgi:PKD repeat protein
MPASVKTFVHSRPLIDWLHAGILSRAAGAYNGETATEANIGAPGSPVSGPQFGGNCAVGGVYYPYSDFPVDFRNIYFFADYGEKWIKAITMDNNNKPVAVKNFFNSDAPIIGMATHPTDGGLYYINFSSTNTGSDYADISTELRKLTFGNTSSAPPVAVASADKKLGPSPLVVQFTGSNSSDPNSLPLTYKWDFGDGSTSTAANPSHTFTSANSVGYTVSLTVTNSSGASDRTTVLISVNNTAPVIVSMTPASGTLYPITGQTTFTLQANVTDNQQAANTLSYKWETFLHHDNHEHPDPVVNAMQSTLTTSPFGCGNETYFYRIKLTVTDATGAATTRETNLYPYCAKVVSFDLINATNGAVLQPLSNGAVINVKSLPTDKLNIRANTTAEPSGSLVFN